MSEETPNLEPTLEEQINLAEELRRTVDERNVIENQYPEMDDLSVFLDSDPEHRKEYDRLWQKFNETRRMFDEKVSNKLWLVQRLREIDKDDLADMIESMFGLEKLEH